MSKTMAEMVGEERDNAIARLNAIPSEIEVMLFLHDQGKILIHAGKEWQDWLNIYNGVDISFSDGVHFPPYMTDTAFIDVKNVDLRKTDGKNFKNLLIEVAKRNRYGGWSKAGSWGEYYTDGSTNRYIAYVRDGKEFGGTLATETEVYNENKTEAENARDLVKYYLERRNILNHDIYIVRGEDISKCIIEKQKQYEKASEKVKKFMYQYYKNTKFFTEQLSNWKEKYPLMEVSKTEGGWITKNTGNGKMKLRTMPMEVHANENHTQEEVCENVKRIYEKLRNAQKGELPTDEVLRIYGLLSEMRPLPEIMGGE